MAWRGGMPANARDAPQMETECVRLVDAFEASSGSIGTVARSIC